MSILIDLTEELRRQRLAELNAEPGDRPTLQKRHGKVWDGRELARRYRIVGFMAPFVVAEHKASGKLGSFEFQHHPRFYFNWQEDRP